MANGTRRGSRTGWVIAAVCCLLLAGSGIVRLQGGDTPLPRTSNDPFQLPPAQAHFVRDDAGVLGLYARKLELLARGNAEELGIHIYVRTVVESEGTLEQLAPTLLDEAERSDEAGSAAAGSILVLIAPREGRARIEVSYALEGLFPDVWVSRLARYQLVPYASYRALGMAVMDVISQVGLRAVAEAKAGRWEVPRAVRENPRFVRRLQHESGGAGAVSELPDRPIDGDLKARVRRGSRERYAPSSEVLESVAAYARSMAELVGDPELRLYTPGSRCLRRHIPVAPFEYWQRADAIRRSAPFEVSVRGSRAVVTSRTPAPGFMPVLLRRIDGRWRIDSVATWKNLFTHNEGFQLRNGATPYNFGGLAEAKAFGSYPELLPVDLRGESLEVSIGRLERRLADPPTSEAQRSREHLEYAELLFRNCWACVDSMPHYREAARLAPGDHELLRLVAERHLYVGFWLEATPYLEAIGPSEWHRLGWAYWNAGELESAERNYVRALARAPSASLRRSLARLRRARREAEAAR